MGAVYEDSGTTLGFEVLPSSLIPAARVNRAEIVSKG
jgi:hypothetical protein